MHALPFYHLGQQQQRQRQRSQPQPQQEQELELELELEQELELELDAAHEAHEQAQGHLPSSSFVDITRTVSSLTSSSFSRNATSSAAISTASSSLNFTANNISISRVCCACAAVKMSCSGEIPCSRCWRLHLPCEPRVISSTRRSSAHKATSAKTSHTHRRHRRRDKANEEGAAVQDGGSDGGSSKSAAEEQIPSLALISELRFRGQDPRAHAALYLQIFQKMHNQGRIARQKVLTVMRVWRMLSLVAEVDVTWGVAAGVAEMLQITPIELEGTQMLGLEMTPELRETRARWALSEMQQQSNALQQGERFHAASQGYIGGLLMFNVEGHKGTLARNAAYNQLFVSGNDHFDDIIRRKLLGIFIQGSAVCPEDRDIITQLYIEMLFARNVPSSQTLFLKTFGNDGKIRLLIANVQWSRHGNEEQIIMRIEEAPPSRHITLTSQASGGCITKTFRQTTFQERVAVSSGGAGVDAGGRAGMEEAGAEGAGAGAAVTAMMCGPFPITPSDAWESMKCLALQGYSRDIFGLPASKERLERASAASVCLPSLLRPDDRGKQKKKRSTQSSSSPLPLLAVQQPEEQMQAPLMSVSQRAPWEEGLQEEERDGEAEEYCQQWEGEEEDLLTMLEPILEEGLPSLLPDIF